MTRLTPAEMRVLRAYALTGNRQEAADALGIALNTVYAHLTAAYRALGVPGALDAFHALGWLTVPDEDEMAAYAIIEDVREAAAHVAQASAALRDTIHALGPVSPVEASVPPDRGPTEPAAHRAMTRPESAA